MKVAVVTTTLNSFGGTTQCAINCIEALKENGIIPTIHTFPLKRFALYNGILKNIKMLFKKDYSYIFDFTNALSYNKRNYFNYIHFPEYILEERGKYNKGIWWFYHLPKRLLNPKSRRVIKNSKIDFACNSKYTAKRIYETVGRRIKIIYPPCDIDKFRNNNKKIRQIISVGGFTGEKKQLMQIEIARSFPEINFEICGSTKRNPTYSSKVKSKSRGFGNVFLYPNIPFNILRDKLTHSLIFLHTSEREPFGISTVEAISAGCIPLVHNSGGQKEVVPFRELRFDNQYEAIRKIENILKMKPKELNSYRTKLQEHIKQFDTKIFKKELISFLKDKIDTFK